MKKITHFLTVVFLSVMVSATPSVSSLSQELTEEPFRITHVQLIPPPGFYVTARFYLPENNFVTQELKPSTPVTILLLNPINPFNEQASYHWGYPLSCAQRDIKEQKENGLYSAAFQAFWTPYDGRGPWENVLSGPLWSASTLDRDTMTSTLRIEIFYDDTTGKYDVNSSFIAPEVE